MSEWLTTQQVADVLGCDRKTVWRWAAASRIPHTVDDNGWRRFDPEVVRALVVVEEATVTPLTQLDRMVSRPAQVRRGFDLEDTEEL